MATRSNCKSASSGDGRFLGIVVLGGGARLSRGRDEARPQAVAGVPD
jgi:hypothetical protein